MNFSIDTVNQESDLILGIVQPLGIVLSLFKEASKRLTCPLPKTQKGRFQKG